MTTEPRERPVGRGTARLAAFTAVALATGSLIGAGAMLTNDNDAPRTAGTPAETTKQMAAAEPVTTTDTAATDAAGTTEPAQTAVAEAAPDEPATAPAGPSSEPGSADVAATGTAPAARTLTDTQSLAARFGNPAPQAETPTASNMTVPRTAMAEPAEIPAAEPGDEIEIAETEAQALAIEERLSAAGAAYFQLPPEPGDPFEAAISDDVPLPRAWANQWVNMRAGPDNDAEVLTVVPGGAEIGAEADCGGWCEVVYEGRRGYIYQSFIRR